MSDDQSPAAKLAEVFEANGIDGTLVVESLRGDKTYVHNPERLTKPLIRRDGVAKTSAIIDFDERDKYFREASWEEALALAVGGLKTIRDESGSNSLAGFGSAKGSNEEAYLFQKLVHTN